MKKILLSAAVVAAALCGVFTANQVNNEVAMSDLEMENVEALASGEDHSGYRVVKILANLFLF